MLLNGIPRFVLCLAGKVPDELLACDFFGWENENARSRSYKICYKQGIALCRTAFFPFGFPGIDLILLRLASYWKALNLYKSH